MAWEDDVSRLVAELRAGLEATLAELCQRERDLIADAERRFDALLAANGAKRCTRCGGSGKLQRLDAGYMKRFGLKDWASCPDCGGTEDFTVGQPGRGFVPLQGS